MYRYSNHNQSVNIKMSTKTSFLIRRPSSDQAINRLNWTFKLYKIVVQSHGRSKCHTTYTDQWKFRKDTEQILGYFFDYAVDYSEINLGPRKGFLLYSDFILAIYSIRPDRVFSMDPNYPKHKQFNIFLWV